MTWLIKNPMGALACRPRSVYNVKSQIFTFCIQRLPFLGGTSTTRNYSKFALYNNVFGLAVVVALPS